MMKKHIAIALIYIYSSIIPVNTLGIAAEYRKPIIEDEDLSSRIEKLEKNFIKFQQGTYAQKNDNKPITGSGSGITPEQLTQLDDLTEQIKSIKGNIEQLQYDITRLNDKLIAFSNDTEFRFNELSQGASKTQSENKILNSIELQLDNKLLNKNTSDQAMIQQKQWSYEQTSPIDNDFLTKSPDEQYQYAYSLLKQKDYESAKEAFVVFINHNSEHKLLSNAHYWLGEIYSQQKDDEKAAIEYLRGYQRNTTGYRAPDNLLKLGTSLSNLGKQREACIALLKLEKEFPNANNSIKSKMQAMIQQLNCG